MAWDMLKIFSANIFIIRTVSLKAVARCYLQILHTLGALVTLAPIIQYLNCQCRIHFEKHAAAKYFSLKAPLLPNLGAGDLLIWARQIY